MIVRYKPVGYSHSMREDQQGDFVRYADTATMLATLERAANMLDAIAGDMEDGHSIDSLRGKYVMAIVNARDDARAALKSAKEPT